MAVDDDIDHVLFHDADVGGGVHGLRRAEEDVGELRAHHRAAPAVGQACAEGLTDQCLGQGRAAHVGHVQRLGNLAVNGAGGDLRLFPQLLRVLRRALQEALRAEGLAVFHQAGLGDLVRKVVNVLALGLDAPLGGDALQLFGILDGVVAALAGLVKGVADFAAVVGVRCRAACGEAQVVTGDNAVDIAAADASRRLRGDAARAHRADTAAGARFAEAAVRRLVLHALLPAVRADLLAVFQKRGGCFLHLFDCDVAFLAHSRFIPPVLF